MSQCRAQGQYVYLVNVSNATHSPTRRALTGFRLQGTRGIITALHGVVDHGTITATSVLGKSPDGPLSIVGVDVEHDLALLSSKRLRAMNADGLEAVDTARWTDAQWKAAGQLRVVGYPVNLDKAEISLSVTPNPEKPTNTIENLVGAATRYELGQRGSPLPTLRVVHLFGLLPGHSGAPVLDSRGRLVAIANGGVLEAQGRITWALPYSMSPRMWRATDGNLSFEKVRTRKPVALFAIDADPQAAEDRIARKVRASLAPEFGVLNGRLNEFSTLLKGLAPKATLDDGQSALRRKALQLYNDGRDLHEAGKIEQASDKYRAALQIDNNIPGAHFNLALTYYAQDNTAKSVAELRTAITQSPDNPVYQFSLAALLFNTRDTAGSIKEFESAISRFPTSVDFRIGIALVLLNDGKFDRAIRELQVAKARNGRAALVHFILGQAFHAKHDLTNAIESYKAAIDLEPREVSGYQFLGSVYIERSEWSEALSVYLKLIELEPRNWQNYVNAGAAYHHTQDLRKAFEAYRSALRIDNSQIGILQYLVAAVPTLYSGDSATKEYRALMTIVPKQSGPRLALVGQLVNQKEYEAALIEAQALVDLEPQVAIHRYTLATVFFAKNLPDKAADSLTRAIALDSSQPTYLYWLAVAQVRQNRLSDAAGTLALYLEREPAYRQVLPNDQNVASLRSDSRIRKYLP